MKRLCPNSQCSSFQKSDFVCRDGNFYRRNDARLIARFRCRKCRRRFSAATSTLECGQKKRRVNSLLLRLLASGVSMRRSALILNIHRTTVKRKLIYWAKKARLSQEKLLTSLKTTPVEHLQFDDLITKEHTKLKPLTVTTAVDAKRRLILTAEVSIIPAFGHLAAIYRRKYPGEKRKNEHKKGLKKVFNTISPLVHSRCCIRSDEHPFYPAFVQKYFPQAQYQRFKSERAAIVGQGELKKLRRDPLFSINHTYAMLRANINRLFRRSWCTTKNLGMLKNHLDLYIYYHNSRLV